MTETIDQDVSWRRKFDALYQVLKYRPKFFIVIFCLSVATAILEGVGMSFILPILEVAQGKTSPEEAGGLLSIFFSVYRSLGIPFTLGYLVAGISTVMITRYTLSFLAKWSTEVIRVQYLGYLQEAIYSRAVGARVPYFDRRSSDEILDGIVTQAHTAGTVVKDALILLQTALTSLIYLGIALALAPKLTLAMGVYFVGLTMFFRRVLESGYTLGDKVADAKEGIQSIAQAGTQGIREVKMLGISDDFRQQFSEATDKYVTFRVKSQKNNQIIQQFYQLATAVSVFVLIYLGIRFSNMSISELGVFLFAMFRLGPRASTLNSQFYGIENRLPHLVRVQEFVRELDQNQERERETRPVPESVEKVEFDTVEFEYESADKPVIDGISFQFQAEEFVAFVGPSGAGKSTIASLLAGLYEPNSGEIRINDVSLSDFDVDDWRSHVAMVRQNPHIFNDTLRGNIAMGRKDAPQKELERVCEIAQVTEFLDELPNEYETELGDDGVRLSGGQRQRVAIARALLQDADVLVLDEATSDLDTSLEQRVQTAIESMDRDYAMLTIAHRLSTVRNADRIYMMEEGHIVERGDHRELLAKKGRYETLYSAQSKSVDSTVE